VAPETRRVPGSECFPVPALPSSSITPGSSTPAQPAIPGLHTTHGNTVWIEWIGGGARHNLNDGVGATANRVDIINCEFYDNGDDGCRVTGNVTPAVLENIQSYNNGGFALRIESNPGGIGSDLSGFGNGYNGVYVSGILKSDPLNGFWYWNNNPELPHHRQRPDHQRRHPPQGGRRYRGQVPGHKLFHYREQRRTY
jgi:hypothetical protein